MNTALEIIKGALSGVIGFPIGRTTLGSRFTEGNHGRITVQLSSPDKPSPEMMLKVQEKVDDIVNQDLPCFVFSIARKKAEDDYGDAMYDKFEVPADVTSLSIFYIEGVNFHASPHNFVQSSGSLGAIKITKEKFRSNKAELEVMFDVFPVSSCVSDGRKCPTCDPPTSEKIKFLNSNTKRFETEKSNESAEGDSKTPQTQKVTPWEVEADGEIDYNKLVKTFGSQLMTEDLIAKIERLTNQRCHRFLRRGLFFSHRDLAQILDLYEKGEKFYLYTGRGPSSEALHLGHLIPFHFTQWLQKAFQVPLVIQLTDDEKFLFKTNLPLEEAHRLAFENAKDIIACGFDKEKTFIFSDLDYIAHMYPMILKIQRFVTFNQTRGIFGFNESTNIGCISFPAVQAAPSFAQTFPIPLKGKRNMPCLIPCAIDQDAYFRMTRDVAPRLKFFKPSLVHSKFFPGLQGPKGKMSSSASNTAIFVTDSPKEIKKKVQSSFSGGQDTKELQIEFGANLSVDVAYQYLKFFLEDDQEFERIGREYASGELLTGQVKARLIEVLTDLVHGHQIQREAVTEEVVRKFMEVRPLDF